MLSTATEHERVETSRLQYYHVWINTRKIRQNKPEIWTKDWRNYSKIMSFNAFILEFEKSNSRYQGVEPWTFLSFIYKNMAKLESLWHFWEFTVVNSRYRNSSWTTEQSEICRNSISNCIWYWKYHWINRPWQRYDYESSFRHAYADLINSISWSQYEAWKQDIDAMHDAIVKMKNYGWSPRN